MAWKQWIVRGLVGLCVLGVFAVLAVQFLQGSVLRGFTNGELEAADYWRGKPAILAGGYGFDNIIGVPEITKQTVHGAGGSWYGSLECACGEKPTTAVRTSVAEADTIPQGNRGYAERSRLERKCRNREKTTPPN
jgi:hypothetical protein